MSVDGVQSDREGYSGTKAGLVSLSAKCAHVGNLRFEHGVCHLPDMSVHVENTELVGRRLPDLVPIIIQVEAYKRLDRGPIVTFPPRQVKALI